MKLYYIGLFQTSPSAAPSELTTTTSLSTIPYFERPKTSTYLTSLATTTIATHTPPHARYTVEYGGYAFHCYGTDDWAGVVICSCDYPSNGAHLVIAKSMDQRGWEVQHIDLAGLMARYQKLTMAVREWEGLSGCEVVWDRIGSFLRRDAESLLKKTERLAMCSKLFYMQANEGQYYCAVV